MNTGRRKFFPLFFIVPFLASCATLTDPEYYVHLASGEMRILTHRVPIQKILADERVGADLKENLRKTVEMREFAIRELGLPATESYTMYMDTGREFAQWALTATPKFSVKPKMWCFPVVGCSSYLPFFDKNLAKSYEKKLSREGYDVSVRGVISYSTGAYFADPVMNTLFELPEYERAGIIFHEMAHEKLLAKNDTAFNEAFAVFVEQTGQYLWIKKHFGTAETEQFLRQKQISAEFSLFITTVRRELERLYAKNLSPEKLRVLKQGVFIKMREDYAALKKKWGGYAGYDRWMAKPMNNARIVGEDEYGNLVPAFEKLFDLSGKDFRRFYEKAAALAALSPVRRKREMQNLSP